MLTIPPLEKIISRSRSSKMRNTNAITNSPSSVTSIETRAIPYFPPNPSDPFGWALDGDLFYFPSICTYPKYRAYNPSPFISRANFCGLTSIEFLLLPDTTYTNCGVNYKMADVVWYGEYVSKDDPGWSTSIRNTFNNIKNKNKDGGGQHNWTYDEIKSVVNGMYILESNGSLCT